MAFVTTLTTKGKQMLASAFTGKPLVFSKANFGSGTAEVSDIPALENIKDEKANGHISGKERENTQTKLTVVLTNDGVSTGFYITEIGIFAKDPEEITAEDTEETIAAKTDYLYAYIKITDGDGGKLPPYDAAPARRQFLIYMYVGLAADVGAILDSKFIYVTEDEFQEHLSDPNAHKDLFSKFQTKTNLLQETSVIETGDYVPIYHPIDNTHYKVDLQKFFTAVRNVLFSGIDGIVKANKNGTVSKAIEGEDYQLPTNKLVSGSTLDDTDTVPFYDASEKAHKSTTLYALISKIKKSSFPDGSGLLKKNGQNIETATTGVDYQPATRKLDASTVEDADSIPIYDASVTGDRRITFSSLKNSLKQYFDQLYTKVAFDSTPTSGSTNAVTSDGIYKAMVDKKIFVAGTTPPTNTNLLWIDTAAVTGGLKYHNGSAWVHVPVAYAT